MKKRVLIIVGAVIAAAVAVAAGIQIERWVDDRNTKYVYPPYIIYNGTFYKDDGWDYRPDIPEEGYTVTDAVVTTLVDGDVLSEVDGTTNVEAYLHGTVYVSDEYPDVIYLRLSGGEWDGRYARFYAPSETET